MSFNNYSMYPLNSSNIDRVLEFNFLGMNTMWVLKFDTF